MRIAILSEPGDYHAAAVNWGLKDKGHDCRCLFLSDLPQRASMTASPNDASFVIDADEQADLRDFDRIWLRRPADPVLPPTLHLADRSAARAFWDIALHDALCLLDEQRPRCVNPARSLFTASSKSLHLGLARACGLAIPATLISSDGDTTRSFISRNAAKGRSTIVKALHTVSWDFGNDGGMAYCDTQLVYPGDIVDMSLKLAPCIFQEQICKSFEVRVTVAGATILAAKLESQCIPEARLDFRHAPNWRSLGCDQIEVPSNVAASIQRFHRAAGLMFGTMDFIVTPDNEWIFLETNTMGNFLWVEATNPAIPLLDMVCTFLVSAEQDFSYRSADLRLALADFTPHGRGWSADEERASHHSDAAPPPLDAPLIRKG